jgi:hypothetical protein
VCLSGFVSKFPEEFVFFFTSLGRKCRRVVDQTEDFFSGRFSRERNPEKSEGKEEEPCEIDDQDHSSKSCHEPILPVR